MERRLQAPPRRAGAGNRPKVVSRILSRLKYSTWSGSQRRKSFRAALHVVHGSPAKGKDHLLDPQRRKLRQRIRIRSAARDPDED